MFQGRYKAAVIDGRSGDYFETASTYIHLNPARAGLLKEGEGLKAYRWSSYAGYVGGKRGRPEWLNVDRVLGNLGLRDGSRGRKSYRDYIEGRIRELRTKSGRKAFRTEWKPIRFGWFVGAEEFRDQLLKRLDKAVEGNQRASYSGESIRQHDEYRAEELIGKGMKCLGIKESDLNGLAKGHNVKCLLAWLAHTRTMASHQWLSDRLQMGNSITVSTYIKRVKEAGSGPLCTAKKDLIRTIV